MTSDNIWTSPTPHFRQHLEQPHPASRASSAANGDSVETAEEALNLMRRLGGTWSGDGCLEMAAYAAKYLDSARRSDDEEDMLVHPEQLNAAAT